MPPSTTLDATNAVTAEDGALATPVPEVRDLYSIVPGGVPGVPVAR